MKLPSFIDNESKKNIAILIREVRKTQGEKQTLLLKKLLLVAAYGTTIQGKIDFVDFMDTLSRHIMYRHLPMRKFWAVELKAKYDDVELFLIPYKIVYFGTITQVEQEIIKLFFSFAQDNYKPIKTLYINTIKQDFNFNP